MWPFVWKGLEARWMHYLTFSVYTFRLGPAGVVILYILFFSLSPTHPPHPPPEEKERCDIWDEKESLHCYFFWGLLFLLVQSRTFCAPAHKISLIAARTGQYQETQKYLQKVARMAPSSLLRFQFMD